MCYCWLRRDNEEKSGIKRAAKLVLTADNKSYLTCPSSKTANPLNENFADCYLRTTGGMENHTDFGDSGGSLFCKNNFTKWELIAVTSIVKSTDGSGSSWSLMGSRGYQKAKN